MKTITIKTTILLSVILLAAGCATSKKHIELSNDFWQERNQKIHVALIEPPKPSVLQVGSQGLLEYGINSAANSKLDKHLSQQDLSWYRGLPEHFSKKLKSQSMNVSYIGQIKSDSKSRKSAISQAQGDKVLIIDVKHVGARREYYSIFPKTPPLAHCLITGELIDTSNNKTLWYHEVELTEGAKDGKWDEPPTFPNFTLALQEATSSAKEELLDSFFSGRP